MKSFTGIPISFNWCKIILIPVQAYVELICLVSTLKLNLRTNAQSFSSSFISTCSSGNKLLVFKRKKQKQVKFVSVEEHRVIYFFLISKRSSLESCFGWYRLFQSQILSLPVKMSKMKASLASAAATSLVVVVAVIVFVVVLRAVNNIIFEMRYFYKVAAVVCHSNDSISIVCHRLSSTNFSRLALVSTIRSTCRARMD